MKCPNLYSYYVVKGKLPTLFIVEESDAYKPRHAPVCVAAVVYDRTLEQQSLCPQGPHSSVSWGKEQAPVSSLEQSSRSCCCWGPGKDISLWGLHGHFAALPQVCCPAGWRGRGIAKPCSNGSKHCRVKAESLMVCGLAFENKGFPTLYCTVPLG